MTPAINLLKKRKIKFKVHEYEHDPKSSSYGLEAAEKMNQNPLRVFKTLVIETDSKDLCVAIVPVLYELNLKKMAKSCGSKKAAMADKKMVERVTGYILGGVSPLGQKKQLKTVIDKSSEDFETIYVSAGRRGLEIEISPSDLADLTRGVFAEIRDD